LNWRRRIREAVVDRQRPPNESANSKLQRIGDFPEVPCAIQSSLNLLKTL
jgi:hypothetical protein